MSRILVVDDDDTLRAMLAAALTSAGHVVLEARDGGEALSLLRQSPPDLVLTDIVMPQKEGLELLMALRREPSPPPIIAMSGATANAPLYLDLARKFGARLTLTKPFTGEALLAAVGRVLTETGAAS